MKQTTLCYLERGDEYLMLHRIKKKNDENHDKADSHAYIAYTVDNLANSITYLFQVKFPLSKRMNKTSIKILRKKNFKGTGPG